MTLGASRFLDRKRRLPRKADRRTEVKKRKIVLCGVAAALALTGCGATVPDLTQEETEIISEYAAGILMKYDKDNGSRLVDLSQEQTAPDAEPPAQAPESDVAAAETEEAPGGTGEPGPAENNATVIDQSQTEAMPAASIEEYYGISDFTFAYTGCELIDSYPEDSGEEGAVYFTMDATEGMKLLVAKFNVTNQSGSEQTLNMMEHGAKFKLSVNGDAGKHVLTTMLLNDMQNYNAMVAAGETVELVSIIEVPADTQVDSLALILSGGDGAVTLQLQ